MTQPELAYLNGKYLPRHEAKISPMDRGFLFGDAIYEVVPCHHRKPIGLQRHIDRLQRNLKAIGITANKSDNYWRSVINTLAQDSPTEHCGIYLHVSRGEAPKRHHTYNNDLTPTEFAYSFQIAPPPSSANKPSMGLKLKSQEDLRWLHCDVKVTALLGNVLHYQHAVDAGFDEALLYRPGGKITEASASNVFCIKDATIYTPVLDHTLLPGITRGLIIDVLRDNSSLTVSEQDLTLQDFLEADEVWLSSSTREIAPVVQIDERIIGSGETGPIWATVIDLFQKHKYEYA
ncbi:MAG: aminotransferase class IV [Halieaceae bacterium]|nr:aminotransferase class IV [Halieaceae bacterium]